MIKYAQMQQELIDSHKQIIGLLEELQKANKTRIEKMNGKKTEYVYPKETMIEHLKNENIGFTRSIQVHKERIKELENER